MKKIAFALMLSGSLLAMSCNSWGKAMPQGAARNTAIEENIRKNLLEDHMTGMEVNVADDGTVTLKGHVKNSDDRARAAADAMKVSGVTRVNNELTIE